MKQWSEAGGKSRCPKCNSLRTSAYKSGNWSEVCALTDEQAAEWFQTASDMSKDEKYAKLKSYKTENVDMHEERKRKRGESLPLSVWAARGFDPVLIEADALPGDVEWKAKLGKCYYVQTEVDDSVESKRWEAHEIMNHASASSMTADAAADSETAEQKKKRLRQDAEEAKAPPQSY